MKIYYNTNSESGTTLKESKEKALRQQNRILSYFQSFPNDTFTPEEVLKTLYSDNTPLTSVRRAITNLTEDGKLVKTDEMRMGGFGKLCHCWRASRIRCIQKEMVF